MILYINLYVIKWQNSFLTNMLKNILNGEIKKFKINTFFLLFKLLEFI